jgi:hypothetical protein
MHKNDRRNNVENLRYIDPNYPRIRITDVCILITILTYTYLQLPICIRIANYLLNRFLP